MKNDDTSTKGSSHTEYSSDYESDYTDYATSDYYQSDEYDDAYGINE